MDWIFNILKLLVCLLYGVTTFKYWQYFFGDKAAAHSRGWLVAALAFHGGLLAFIGVYFGRPPLATWSEGLLFCTFLVGGAHLASEHFSRTRQVGIFTLLPTALGVIIAVLTLHQGMREAHNPLGPLFTFHIVVSLASYACYGIATIISVMYMLLFQRLKQKQFDVYFKKLPPLQKLEHLSAVWVWIGGVLMAGAFLMGWRWAPPGVDTQGHILPIALVWLAFTALVVWRQVAGWRGLRYILSVLAAFVFLMVIQVVGGHGY